MELGTARGVIEIGFDGSGIAQAQRAFSELETRSQSLGQSMTNAGATLATVGAGITAPFVGAAKSAADFEQQLSAIASVGGAEAVSRMDELKAAALEMGSQTSFSASEAAAGMEELVKAGVPVQDVLDGAARSALDLAAATGTSVPQAATIMSNALNVFGDGLTQFGTAGEKATYIADLLAQAANASATDVNEIGFALSQAGNVADSFGIGIDEVASALGLFANAGLRGSDAGTSLKTMLLALLDPTDKQKNAIQELGLSYQDFYDQQGNFIGLGEAAQLLQDSMAGLTDAQRQNALAVLFGSDAYRAAKILTDAGVQGMIEFEGQMAAAGTTSEQAAVRLDNLKGALETLRGSVETAAILIGDQFIPIIRPLVERLTELVNRFSELSPELQRFVAIGGAAAGLLTAAAGGALLFGGQIAEGVKSVQALAGSFREMLTAGRLLSAVFSPIGIAIAAVGLAVVAYRTNFLGFADAIDRIRSGVAWAITGFRDLYQRLNDYGVLTGAAAAVQAFGSVLQGVTGLPVAGFFAELAFGVKTLEARLRKIPAQFKKFSQNSNAVTGLGKAFDAVGRIIRKVTGFDVRPFFAGISNAVDAVALAIGRFVDGLGDAWSSFDSLVTQGVAPLDAAVQALVDAFPDAEGALSFFGGQIQTVIDTLGTMKTALGDAVTALQAGDFGAALGALVQIPVAAVEGFVTLVANAAAAIGTLLAQVDWQSIWRGAKDAFATAGSVLADLGQTIFDAIGTAVSAVDWNAVWALARNAGGAIVSALGDAAGAVAGWLREQVAKIDWSSVWTAITGTAAGIVAALGDFVAPVTDWLRSAISAINWAGVWETIREQAAAVVGRLGDLAGALAGWVASSVAAVDWAQAAADIGASLGSALSAAVDWAKDAASGLLGKLLEEVEKLDITARDVFEFGKDVGESIGSAIAVAVAGVDWAKVIKGIADGLVALAKISGAVLGAVAVAIVGTIAGAVSGLSKVDWGPVVTSIKDGIRGAIESLATFASDIWDAITTLLEDAAPSVDDWAAAALSAAANFGESLLDQVGALTELGKDAWDDVVAKLKAAIPTQVAIGTWMSTFASRFAASVIEKVKALANLGRDVWSQVTAKLRDQAPTSQQLQAFVSGMTQQFKVAIILAIGAIADFGKGIWEAVKTKIAESVPTAEELRAAAKQLASSLGDALVQAIKNAPGLAKRLWDAIVSKITGFGNDDSEARAAGEAIGQGVADGLSAQTRTIQSAAAAARLAAMDGLGMGGTATGRAGTAAGLASRQMQWSTGLGMANAAALRMPESLEATVVIDGTDMGRFVVGTALAPIVEAARRTGTRREAWA